MPTSSDDAPMTCSACLSWMASQESLAPGQLLEQSVSVSGVVRARRDHSASVSFLELADSTDSSEQMLQACINRTKCDGTPRTRHALELLNIGDKLLCTGPVGRTRTGRVHTSCCHVCW